MSESVEWTDFTTHTSFAVEVGDDGDPCPKCGEPMRGILRISNLPHREDMQRAFCRPCAPESFKA